MCAATRSAWHRDVDLVMLDRCFVSCMVVVVGGQGEGLVGMVTGLSAQLVCEFWCRSLGATASGQRVTWLA